MIGETFHQYQIIERLGGGGMGVVYKAHDTKLDRTVALKFLPPELSRDEQAKERFKLEARAASALNHPNICAIHDIQETDDGQLFIVMALYEGETLRDRMEWLNSHAERESVEDALSIVRQVADGLAAAHERGIVHRDIKPANIMLTERDRAVILDFGLAKLAMGPALTTTGSTMGTIAYMAPEQAQAGEVDHRSDIWALGALMYEMLSGRKPFSGDFDQAVIYNILNVDPELLSSVDPDLPRELAVIVRRALQKDRDLRYGSADELLRDLDAFSGGASPGLPTRISVDALNRKRRRLAGILAAGAAIALATGVLLTWGTGRGSSIESVAVIPLENLSGDADQQYFADGMTEAMITELSKISGLKVISRQSVMRYKNTELTTGEIADQLGVDALVQGSVIREGDDVRITAHLISGSTDEHLWADSFDRQLSGILKLHGEVARAIAEEIEVNLTTEERTRLSSAEEVDPQAYESYLRGRQHLYRLGRDDIETAEAYFNRALEIDPDFTLAILGLKSVVGVSRQMGYMPPKVALARSAELRERALVLDSTLSEVQQSLASFETWTNWNWDAGERAFRRAIELDPNNAQARAFYSHLLNILCRPDEAMEQIEIAVELDPFNGFVRSLYAIDLLFVGRLDEAIEEAREVLKTSPMNLVAYTALKSAYNKKKDYVQAYEIERSIYLARRDSGIVKVLDEAYEEGGYVFARGEIGKALAARADSSFVSGFQIAAHLAKGGLHDESFRWLDRAFENHASNMPYIAGIEAFDGLHGDPRFIGLLERMNLKLCDK